jgi:hypothetical protein
MEDWLVSALDERTTRFFSDGMPDVHSVSEAMAYLPSERQETVLARVVEAAASATAPSGDGAGGGGGGGGDGSSGGHSRWIKKLLEWGSRDLVNEPGTLFAGTNLQCWPVGTIRAHSAAILRFVDIILEQCDCYYQHENYQEFWRYDICEALAAKDPAALGSFARETLLSRLQQAELEDKLLLIAMFADIAAVPGGPACLHPFSAELLAAMAGITEENHPGTCGVSTARITELRDALEALKAEPPAKRPKPTPPSAE